MSKICNQYVGVACVDGNCPKAHEEEHQERGMDVIRGCDECIFYKGCEDCAFYETQYCIKWKEVKI